MLTRGSAGTVRLGLLASVLPLVLGACIVQADVECYDLSSVDCGRAVALASSVLSDRRTSVAEFFAHDGACAWWMPCPERVHQLTAGKWITVDVTFEDGSLAVVRIDRQAGEPWIARCADVIKTAHGDGTATRLEPCR
jgi:hypothetical protein